MPPLDVSDGLVGEEGDAVSDGLSVDEADVTRGGVKPAR
jgi:hypothetical protein